MAIKPSKIKEVLKTYDLDKTDTSFINNALKKRADDMQNELEKQISKAEMELEKAKRKYQEKVKNYEVQVINESIRSIADYFNITLKDEDKNEKKVRDEVENSEQSDDEIVEETELDNYEKTENINNKEVRNNGY